MRKLKSLTHRQASFVKWFLMPGPTQFHATRSARLAGYRWPSKQGSRLLTYPTIARLLEFGVNLMAAEPITCPHCGGIVPAKEAIGRDVHVDSDVSRVDIGYSGSESTGGGQVTSAFGELESFARFVRWRRGD